MLIIGMNKQDILSIRCNDKDSHEKSEKLWYNHRIKTREEITIKILIRTKIIKINPGI